MTQNTLTKPHPSDGVEHTRNGTTFSPRVDILEHRDELLLYADLPGVTAENLDIRFENGELMIHGRCPARRDDVRYVTQEYAVGDFYRAFSISEVVDASRISAELKHGVLTIHLPKSEKVKPKRIAVTNA